MIRSHNSFLRYSGNRTATLSRNETAYAPMPKRTQSGEPQCPDRSATIPKAERRQRGCEHARPELVGEAGHSLSRLIRGTLRVKRRQGECCAGSNPDDQAGDVQATQSGSASSTLL